jgi:hypothetical protein
MKSFLAVLAGLVFTVLLSVGLDSVMEASGVFPKGDPTGMSTGDWLIATGYRLVAAIGGGWVTARLAPSRPMTHAIVLGGIGTALALAGLIGSWMVAPKMGPLWYPALLVITAMPCTWFGAKLNR